MKLLNQKDQVDPSVFAVEIAQGEIPMNRRRRILIADDDFAVRHALARVLEGEDYRVLLAKSGSQAVFMFLNSEPDLVLLDINMPDKDGWTAFEVMEKSRPLVPVIVITARPNQYEHAMQVGIDALMEKPLNLHLLLKTIAGLLGESDAARVQRLTRPQFQTELLKSESDACPGEKRP